VPTPTIAIVSSGFRASQAITLGRPDRPFVIHVPSYAGVSLSLQCALTSDATSAQYVGVHGPLGSTGLVTVYSAAGGGFSPGIVAPTSYVRLLTATAVTIPLSCTILSVQRTP
jgi:hypothetical protein